MYKKTQPEEQGLYDPRFEHDSCGVGFVCNIKGKPSNEIVLQGLEVLNRLAHRGATGSDPETGDGAGILIQIPHEFFSKKCDEIGLKLPVKGGYGTGLIFLPSDIKEKESCKALLVKIAKEEGQEVIGWRSVPIDDSTIGVTARKTKPLI